jgi:glycosyltransferase involved in cell wall biosynthesis
MDGMEWKRTKYNKYVQHFLMYSEKIAVKHSHYLVADSLGIKEYLDKKYLTDAYFSAYTANIPSKYSSDFLANYLLVPYTYNLLIARMEPENNIDMILEAHTINGNNDNLVVIGNCTNKYGSTLVEKYKNYSNIKFIGAIYDKETIDSIRYYSKMYFHGHSVGGTNPSLLEAMSCECNIIAHNNIFNISVLGNDAYYFSNSIELNKIIVDYENQVSFFGRCKSNNLNKIKTIYSESHIFCDLKNKLILWNNKID